MPDVSQNCKRAGNIYSRHCFSDLKLCRLLGSKGFLERSCFERRGRRLDRFQLLKCLFTLDSLLPLSAARMVNLLFKADVSLTYGRLAASIVLTLFCLFLSFHNSCNVSGLLVLEKDEIGDQIYDDFEKFPKRLVFERRVTVLTHRKDFAFVE